MHLKKCLGVNNFSQKLSYTFCTVHIVDDANNSSYQIYKRSLFHLQPNLFFFLFVFFFYFKNIVFTIWGENVYLQNRLFITMHLVRCPLLFSKFLSLLSGYCLYNSETVHCCIQKEDSIFMHHVLKAKFDTGTENQYFSELRSP